jgi:hypothetical protein
MCCGERASNFPPLVAARQNLVSVDMEKMALAATPAAARRQRGVRRARRWKLECVGGAQTPPAMGAPSNFRAGQKAPIENPR